MNSLFIVAISIVLFWLGYRFYAKSFERVLEIDPKSKTPAHTKYDAVDFVPARHWTVLFGHHFASIAGAAPIIGPVIAVSIWGWGPSLLWIVLGTIFIGGIHDFGSLMLSVKHQGSTVADITQHILNRRAKLIFAGFIWLTLILVIAVFVHLCAKTLSLEPRIAIPTFGLIFLAVIVGIFLYRLGWNQTGVTISAFLILALLIILGNKYPIILGKNSVLPWSYILLFYCFFASVIPVNILLQPRDYLSAFLLLFGVVLGYAGLILSHPKVNVPAFIGFRGGLGPLWPMLFVTIACGAISGFHSLIASGTTSKQISTEADAKRIGYGAMVMEGVVALLALIVVAAGLSGRAELSGMLSGSGSGPIGAFGQGFKNITSVLLGGYGGFVAITILNAFILTTLDTATRIGRYLTEELFGIKNRYIATVIVVVISGWLGISGKWAKIWPIFGSANQLVAALVLIILTAWLFAKKERISFTLAPAIFMLLTTAAALVYNLAGFIKEKDYILIFVSFALIILAIILVYEAGKHFLKRMKNV